MINSIEIRDPLDQPHLKIHLFRIEDLRVNGDSEVFFNILELLHFLHLESTV